MTMLAQLEDYYRECRILSTAFRCRHECECRKRGRGQDMYPLLPKDTAIWSKEAEKKFTPARSAYVGRLYGASKGVPRLLFLSLDPGSSLIQRDPGYNIASDQSRLPQEVKEGLEARMERVRVRPSASTPTLRGMCKMALRILKEFSEFPPCDLIDIVRHYAHVNAVKCTLNLPKRRKVPIRMFEKCRSYLPREIELLKPHVIVTMGDDAGVSAAHIFESTRAFNCVPDNGEIVILGQQSIFWIHSPHPAVRDGSFHQFIDTGVAPAIERVRKFISNRDS